MDGDVRRWGDDEYLDYMDKYRKLLQVKGHSKRRILEETPWITETKL